MLVIASFWLANSYPSVPGRIVTFVRQVLYTPPGIVHTPNPSPGPADQRPSA